MQIQLLSLHHSTNNYSKSQKLPSEVSHILYQGAALLCPRKFLCAVSCTGHGPSQLFTINITVALAVPLRSYFHYTRCCTNTGGMWGCVLPKEPKWEKLQYCHFLYNLYFFFLNLKIQRKLAHLWAYPETHLETFLLFPLYILMYN